MIVGVVVIISDAGGHIVPSTLVDLVTLAYTGWAVVEELGCSRVFVRELLCFHFAAGALLIMLERMIVVMVYVVLIADP